MRTTWPPEPVLQRGLPGSTRSVPATHFLAGIRNRSRPWLIWRSILAAPFALALLLTLILGPPTIDSQYVSAGSLAGTSLVTLVLLLIAADWLLIPLGLVGLAFFPLLAGVGFYFAPAWAVPAVAISFYGSILASAAAILTGIVGLLRHFLRGRRTATLVKVTGVALLAVVVTAMSTSPAQTQPRTSSVASDVKAINLGPIINSGHRDAEPSFTADGHTMYFNCNDDKICASHLVGPWEGGRWVTPKLLAAPINSQYYQVEPLISPTGDKLYITSGRPFGSGEGMPGLGLYLNVLYLVNTGITDQLGVSVLGGLGHDKIWVSYLRGGTWTIPQYLNRIADEPPVDGTFNDHCIFVSADGSEVFWTSDRPGGFGGNDIWTMRRVSGSWSKPENLGPNVNGPSGEHHAMLTPNGQNLYITSDRPGGYGGEDVYVTTRQADGGWSKLVNVGPPINGQGNDRCPVLTPDGRIYLFDSDRAGGYGSKDLWWLYYQDVPGHT